MKPLAVSAFTATSALGRGLAAHWRALREEHSGLRHATFETATLDTWIGEVDGLDAPLPEGFAAWDCRNHRLAEAGLAQDGFADAVAAARQRYGAARVGVFIGTSTSGVQQIERAYRDRDRSTQRLPESFNHRRTQNIYAPAAYVRQRLQLAGPSLAISTACSSSAKVFASAERAIAAGLCDAAVVGGIDSLCLTTLYGFHSLQLLSSDICRPADVQRNGLSIGEAAGFALLVPAAATQSHTAPLWLEGYGESSDAYHMSAPDPQGRGALDAMDAALRRAGLAPGQIGYVNLHGTATPANDQAEDQAVCALFGTEVACSSTKGWTGHTLGAAGIVEAVLALLCLREGWIPRSLNTRQRDPRLRAGIVMHSQPASLRHVLSNSFGFGGNNCSLVFGTPESRA